jgi:hypothetical protein
MDSYQKYVSNKTQYLKLKNNIDLSKNDFIFNKNMDYKLKCKKYNNKIVELIGGFRIGTEDNSIILPEDISKYEILLKNLNMDDKLKLLETFVVTEELFREYLNEPYFNQDELAIIRRDCNSFARNGTLRLLKFARENNPPCPWNELTCAYAAKNGHLNILQWVRSQDPPCPWSKETCIYAAENGHLDVLKWVRNQVPPCPWNSQTCSLAALRGHLNILQWLREQNPPCPWNEETCKFATQYGRLDILQWIRSQNPPFKC